MAKPWEDDNCAAMKAHYAVFSIPKAAAMWCGVPEDQIDEIVGEAKPLSESCLGKCIWTHYAVPCMEPRSRAIAEAIEDGSLPHGREDGKTLPQDELAAAHRRHVFGRDLRNWMEKTFPSEKPAFLFDDIEHSAQSAISADAYRSLKADRGALQKRVDNATETYKTLRQEKDAIAAERDSLKPELDKSAIPNERVEATYLNIIGAMLDPMLGKSA